MGCMAKRAAAGAAVRGSYRRRSSSPDPVEPDGRVRIPMRVSADQRALLRTNAQRRGLSLNGYLCWLIDHAQELEQLHPNDEQLPLSA